MEYIYKQTAAGTADISDASGTVQETYKAPFNGYLRLDRCFAQWTEATGTQTTTVGVLSIEVGGVEVATLTASQGGAVGDTQLFTPNATYVDAANPVYRFSVGDVIRTKVKTQAVDGTTTGDGVVFLALCQA